MVFSYDPQHCPLLCRKKKGWSNAHTLWLSIMRSIIEGAEFEIALRMEADRADLRRVFADDDMAAVAAFPNREIIADEDDAFFDVVQELAITFFVVLLDRADHPEFGGNFAEAFFRCDLGEFLIHIGPFVVFAIRGVFEVDFGGRDFAIMEVFEPELGVLFLVQRGLEEDLGDLLIAFLLRFGRIVLVFGVGLAFSGESGLQALLGFAAF